VLALGDDSSPRRSKAAHSAHSGHPSLIFPAYTLLTPRSQADWVRRWLRCGVNAHDTTSKTRLPDAPTVAALAVLAWTDTTPHNFFAETLIAPNILGLLERIGGGGSGGAKVGGGAGGAAGGGAGAAGDVDTFAEICALLATLLEQRGAPAHFTLRRSLSSLLAFAATGRVLREVFDAGRSQRAALVRLFLAAHAVTLGAYSTFRGEPCAMPGSCGLGSDASPPARGVDEPRSIAAATVAATRGHAALDIFSSTAADARHSTDAFALAAGAAAGDGRVKEMPREPRPEEAPALLAARGGRAAPVGRPAATALPSAHPASTSPAWFVIERGTGAALPPEAWAANAPAPVSLPAALLGTHFLSRGAAGLGGTAQSPPLCGPVLHRGLTSAGQDVDVLFPLLLRIAPHVLTPAT
jgi:hypothetical protein